VADFVSEDSQGYQHPAYSESLAEFGTPRLLPACGGAVLVRAIPGSSLRDAMGCYPIFCCRHWRELGRDIVGLQADLVSLSLVADPFGDHRPEDLRRAVSVVVPFKEHYIVDLTMPIGVCYSRNHRRTVARAHRAVRVERCQEPRRLLVEWIEMFDLLIARHRLTGMRAFSRVAFEKQLSIPGLVAFCATHAGETVGIHLWFEQGDVGYGHLGATTARGHQLSASYALYAAAMEYFAGRLHWLNLGGAAGPTSAERNGLADFKRGWATGVRQAYFCGAVLNGDAYTKLTAAEGRFAADYFPAYRAGEFG
jgi:hypothetical protein